MKKNNLATVNQAETILNEAARGICNVKDHIKSLEKLSNVPKDQLTPSDLETIKNECIIIETLLNKAGSECQKGKILVESV